MANLIYPDSLWYTLQNVYYWPYRGWEMYSSPQTKLPRGEYRYFRYNILKKYAGDAEKQAAAACIRLNGRNCYEVADGDMYLCEGFLEPKCEGVNLGHLIEYLHPYAIEVATESVWGLEESIADLDDFLSFDYHHIHPVTLAGADTKLLKESFYPVAAFYKGRRPTTLYRPPLASEANQLLESQGMGFYQPYLDRDPVALSFVLYTADKTPTPRELSDLLMADYVAVNLNPLDADEQRALHAYDAGKNVPAAVTRFFESAGRGTADVLDISSTLLANLKYVAYAGIGLATAYAAFQVYKFSQEGKQG
jgi:hypothetical protein